MEKIEGLNWNISNAIGMSNLFMGCNKLTSVSQLNLDISNVLDMSGMFKKCLILNDISGISKFNTRNVKYINSMFQKM